MGSAMESAMAFVTVFGKAFVTVFERVFAKVSEMAFEKVFVTVLALSFQTGKTEKKTQIL
jgi:hypothetical protein